MKNKALPLLTLTLLGALLLTGCGDAVSDPITDTTTASPKATDPSSPDLLLPTASLGDEIEALVNNENASYQDLLDLVGMKPHIEDQVNYKYDAPRYYKVWRCEDDQLLLVTCEHTNGSGSAASNYSVTDYEFWRSPLQALYDRLEHTAPASLTVSIEADDGSHANTVSEANEIDDIFSKLEDYKLFRYEDNAASRYFYPDSDGDEYDYWCDMIDHGVIEARSFKTDVLDVEGESIGTIEFLLLTDERSPLYSDSGYGALRYTDGTGSSEWIRTDFGSTKSIVTQLYSGELPPVDTSVEPSDYIWEMYLVDGYANDDGMTQPPNAELYAAFLNTTIDPDKAKDRSYEKYYHLSESEYETIEFAVYFLYYDWDSEYRDANGKLRGCNWDALVDHLADYGIEEIGRARGFTIPIFAATVAELEQLDSKTLQDVMGVADYSEQGITVMLSGPTEAYNQGDVRYATLPASTEANK